MSTNFEEMMKTMMETMMAQYMEKAMKEMFSNMMGNPEVAPAEVEPAKKTLSRDEFLALAEEKPVIKTSADPVDLVVSQEKARTLVFNQPVSKDIWTINYINLKKNYPNVKYDKVTHGFHWNANFSNEFKVACQSFKVVTSLSEADKKAVEEYCKERARKRAEYYNNLAK